MKVRINGLQEALQQLDVAEEEYERKCRELRVKIGELIEKYSEPMFRSSSLGQDVEVFTEDGGDVTVVFAVGEQAVFVEFGTGVHRNTPVGTSPHPKGEELGFTIGSYGKGNGAKHTWGYMDEDGEIRYTHGTQARMPMYTAENKVLRDITEIAREVFYS